jgi:hypothetical protein
VACPIDEDEPIRDWTLVTDGGGGGVTTPDPHMDKEVFLRELARKYNTSAAANLLLDKAFHDDYGRERRPNIDATLPDAGWNHILTDLDNGAVQEAPYRRLLAVLLSDFPGNRVFRELADMYHVVPVRTSNTEPVSPRLTPPPMLPARRRRRTYAVGATGMIVAVSLAAAALLVSPQRRSGSPAGAPQLSGPSQVAFGRSFSLSGTGWQLCTEGTQINFFFNDRLIAQKANLDAHGAFVQSITVPPDGKVHIYDSSDYISLTRGQQYTIRATTISGQKCTQEKPTTTLTII